MCGSFKETPVQKEKRGHPVCNVSRDSYSHSQLWPDSQEPLGDGCGSQAAQADLVILLQLQLLFGQSLARMPSWMGGKGKNCMGWGAMVS